MSDAKFFNLLSYVGIWIGIALAGALGLAIGTGDIAVFADGQILAPAREEIASAIALLVAGGSVWLAANRPRFGSENLARQANALKAGGTKRDDMLVVPQADLIEQLLSMTPEDRAALTEELARRAGVKL